jgi:hypothetical protein
MAWVGFLAREENLSLIHSVQNFSRANPWGSYGVVMKISIFWYVMGCSPLKGNRSFGSIYRLSLQGRSISQARNLHGTWISLLHNSYWSLIWLILKPWWRRRHFPPKRRLNLSELQGIVSQNIESFRLKYIAKVKFETSQESIFSTECSGCCSHVEIFRARSEFGP